MSKATRNSRKFAVSKLYCDTCGQEPNLIGSAPVVGQRCKRVNRYWYRRETCGGTLRKK